MVKSKGVVSGYGCSTRDGVRGTGAVRGAVNYQYRYGNGTG